MTMRMRLALFAGVAAILAVPAAADAQNQRGDPVRRDQDAVFENRQQGRAMPLRVIERRVITQMRGADYLGNPIYFERSNTYRMTFIRSGNVIHVEVDAQSGRIRNRTDR